MYHHLGQDPFGYGLGFGYNTSKPNANLGSCMVAITCVAMTMNSGNKKRTFMNCLTIG